METLLKLASMQDRIDNWFDKFAAKGTTKDPAGERQGRTAAYMKKQEELDKKRMEQSRQYHSKRPSISDKPKKITECFNEKSKKWGPCAPASSSKKIVPAPQKKKEKVPDFGLPAGI